MSHTKTTYPAISPSDIAAALEAARPDLQIEVDAHGPTGLTLIVEDPYSGPDYNPDSVLFFGTAGGYLGWSNGDGEKGGGWENLTTYDPDEDTDDSNYFRWQADKPMTDGMIALARIAGIVAEELTEEL